MLDDLSLRIDATDSKLTAANKRLKAFIRANEGEHADRDKMTLVNELLTR